MDLNYNISDLFAESFGLKVGKAYDPKVGNGRPDDPKGVYQGIEFIDAEEAERLSYLGTPVLFPITFVAGTYKRYDEQGKIEDVQMEDFQLPVTCIADFKRAKQLATTNISGGKGTVKELFGFEDWQINIKGFFLFDKEQPQGLKTPLEQETRMVQWENLACSVGATGAFFGCRSIEAITLKELNVNSKRGQPGIRPFSIPCLSDEAVELQIGGL